MKRFIYSVLLAATAVRADEPKKSDSKLPLGKDTTVVTGPLDKDGFLDYEAALNEQLSKGIAPEKNANALLVQVFGRKPEGSAMPPQYYKLLGVKEPPAASTYFLDIGRYLREIEKLNDAAMKPVFDQHGLATQRPWSAAVFPKIADWLEANEKPLALVREAVIRPEYYNPLVSSHRNGPGSLMSALLSSVQKCREVSGALTARAMLRTAEGKTDEAWTDLLACHRLGRLVARGGTIIEMLVGIAIDTNAANADVAFLANAKLDSKRIQLCRKDLEALPPMPAVADKIGVTERFMFLDTLQMTLRGDAKGNAVGPLQSLKPADWTPVLRDANALYDRMAAATRRPERAKREKEFDKIEEELKALKKDVKESPDDRIDFSKLPAKSIVNVMISLMTPALRKVQGAHDRSTQINRNLRVAFALAAFHAEQGKYPAKLDELSPTYLAKVHGDLFADKPLIYKPAEGGYLLYSVGPNGKDDGGRTSEDNPKGDDFRVKMPPELKK
jgi:hypothetical protein